MYFLIPWYDAKSVLMQVSLGQEPLGQRRMKLGGTHLVLPVLDDLLICLLVLLRRLLQLDAVDLYPEKLCREVFVEDEFVTLPHLTPLARPQPHSYRSMPPQMISSF